MNDSPATADRNRTGFEIDDESRHSEAGDTLIEVLMTLVVASLCAVAFLVAFTTAISASAEHRTLVSMDTVLRSVSEQAVSQIQQQPNPLFASCATPATYSGVGFTAPAGYSATITSVDYWNGSSFGPTCAAGSSAPQLIGVSVTGPLGTASSISLAVNDLSFSSSASEAQLVFTIQPVGGAHGTPLATQPTVTIEDAGGNPVLTNISTVNLAITSGTGTGGAVLSGCTQSESQGVVTFTGCTINDAGTGYTLTATDGSLTAASSAFTVS
ncbi:MAG: hypothetical protein EPN30_04085 [Actinomycetota bacterium]|nr:MAG: hypothetical protein EPN30_04085 [Actinomycetota bacterium]